MSDDPNKPANGETVPVVSPNDPFRTAKGSGKEPSAAPELASKANRTPAATPHASWSENEDDDKTYGGAGVVGEEKDNSTRHEGERRSTAGS